MGPVVIISFVANHMHSTLTVRRSGYVIRRSRFNLYVGQNLATCRSRFGHRWTGSDHFRLGFVFQWSEVVLNFKGWLMRQNKFQGMNYPKSKQTQARPQFKTNPKVHH